MMADYISREAALQAANEWVSEACMAPVMRVSRLFDKLAKVPAADVAEVVHGRWEQDADGDWYCTNCGEVVAICDSGRERTYRKPYCPNCGVKMDGKKVVRIC